MQNVGSAVNSSGPHVDDSLIGTIAKVHGPVVDISCTRLPPLHQALRSAMNHETYIFEVYQHLDEHNVRAITLHRTSGLRRGMPVFDTGAPVHVPAWHVSFPLHTVPSAHEVLDAPQLEAEGSCRRFQQGLEFARIRHRRSGAVPGANSYRTNKKWACKAHFANEA